MLENELRKDYLLNRWVIIAKNRKKRPTDFIKNESIINESTCPLCPNNEQMTPPAVLVYLPANGKPKTNEDGVAICNFTGTSYDSTRIDAKIIIDGKEIALTAPDGEGSYEVSRN